MHDGILKSGLDTLLIAVPFVGLLFITTFRLDTIIAAPKRASVRQPPPGADKHGRVLFSDPDGRPWKEVH